MHKHVALFGVRQSVIYTGVMRGPDVGLMICRHTPPPLFSVCLSVRILFGLSVRRSVCSLVRLSVCLLHCRPCLFDGLSVRLAVCLSAPLSCRSLISLVFRLSCLAWCVRGSLATTCVCTTPTRRGDYALEGTSRTSATSTSCHRPPSGTKIYYVFIVRNVIYFLCLRSQRRPLLVLAMAFA